MDKWSCNTCGKVYAAGDIPADLDCCIPAVEFDPTEERLWKHGFLLKPINRVDEVLSRFRVYRSVIGRIYGLGCDWYDCSDVRGRIAHWIIDQF